MANIDRPSRPSNACTCILPTPSPTPYTPYVSPLCELSKEDIDNILDSIEAYMNDPDDDLPYPSDETIDELDGDCKDAQTFEQKRRIKKLVKKNFKDLNAIVTMFGALSYSMSSILEDVYTNKESRFLEDFGVLLDDEIVNEEFDLGELGGVTTINQQVDNVISQKDKIAETIPNAITNAIDNWVKNGKLSLVDKIRLSVNRKTKDFFEFAIGEDVGFVIGPSDLQKFKDSEWGNLAEEFNDEFIENPNG